MKALVQFSRFAVGALFVFSGFVKAVDPRGTAIKLDKYYVAWSEQLGDWILWFSNISLPMSYFIVSAELVLGIFLLLNFRKKLTIKLLLGVIVFFTILTFYTAITGEPSDCGCFGDFLVIEPWTSFFKDVVLFALIVILYKGQDKLGKGFNGPEANLVVGVLSVITFGFSLYNIVQLPIIDFRPYAVGSDMKSLTLGTPASYEYLLISKEDENETIQVKDLTSEILKDYKYKEQVMVDPGEEPKVLEFRIEDEQGENVTEKVLYGKSALIVARKVNKLNVEKFVQLKELVQALKKEGKKVYIIAGFSKETSKTLGYDFNEVEAVFASIDEDLSKAMIRSNFGVIVLDSGIVKSKEQF